MALFALEAFFYFEMGWSGKGCPSWISPVLVMIFGQGAFTRVLPTACTHGDGMRVLCKFPRQLHRGKESCPLEKGKKNRTRAKTFTSPAKKKV